MSSWLDELPGSGEMLDRLRAHDWAATSLGPPDTWPERLRGAVSLSMTSRFPLMVAWGPELVQVYNEAYLPIFGEKHPQLGERIRDTWSEIWHVVGPLLQGVLDTREATWAEDQQLWIDRLGFAEDTYFTFSYSPVLDEQQVARGVLATAVETTEKVIGARRSGVLAAVRPGDAVGSCAAAHEVLGQLAGHAEDVPFALVYLAAPGGGHALAAGSLPDGPWAPPSVGAGDEQVWPLHLAGDEPVVVDVPAGLVARHASSGAAVRQAGLVRLGDFGVLVCGLSPARRVDAAHLAFLTALGAQVRAVLKVAQALADLQALADERVAAERELALQEAERQRRAAEERFRFAGARVGMWSVDLLTQRVVVDENLERMFGVEPGSLRTVDEVLSRIEPDDRQHVVDALTEVARVGGEYVTDYRVVLPDGTRRTFQARGTTEPEEGPATALHGALWDATDAFEAQAAMRAADEQLRTALEAAPWGSAIVEPDGRVVRVNRALCELLGRPREELLELPFQSLLHPGDEPGLDGRSDGVVREVRLLGADEVPTWVSLSSAPVRDEKGDVLHFVVHVHDQSERKQMEADLKLLADHDVLTGLLNRRRFSEELELAVKGAGRFGDGAVLMIDMDGLKHANDTYGHSVGDALLVALADALRGRLRETDISARLGGDEFAVILPGADEVTAQAVAAELLSDLGRMAPLGTRLSASIGITLLAGGDRDRTAEDVITEADMAMYAAKDAGVGQVRTFRGSTSRQLPFRPRRWTDRIRTALETDGFVLHAQPIRSLQGGPGGRDLQAELLLRMVGDDGRLLLPTSFLLAAERSTLIQDIDRWVLHHGVRELARRQALEPRARLAVNLSGRSITDPGLARYVADELQREGADPSGLVLEVTETAAVTNVAHAHAFVHAMSELGCALSLDDFGAGFTSFQYLKQLDFDYLKIDGEFIRDLTTNPTNQCIVQALAELASSLGKRTVAEHVGDEQTLAWLARHGVDYAQGFHIGIPLPLQRGVVRHAVS